MSDTAWASQLDTAVPESAEALLAALRADGVVAPRGDRFSPANTAAALTALHTAAAHDGAAPPGPAARARSDRAVRRLCATQRPDGGWAMAGVPTETLSTAVVAAALHLVAPDEARAAVTAARDLLRRRGGAASLPDPAMAGLARQFAALAGQDDPAALPRLPLELLLLPGLARRALSLRLPIFCAMALGQSVRRERGALGRRCDAALRPRALAVVREAFDRERGTGGFSGDPWLTALVTIGVGRSGLAPGVSRASAAWLAAAEAPDGGWDLMPLDITWTGFATAALLEAGYAADPRLDAVREMFRRRQQDVPFPALACPGGHWGFSTDRSWPMALETAEVSSLLHRLPGGADDPHARRGIGWLTATQDRAGSWSLAVRDSRPGGFGPCPQMTARTVTALLDCGAAPDDRRVVRALRWLARRQEPDGALPAMWYRGRVPGTAAALVAFARAGQGGTAAARRAGELLRRAQRPDGSWGAGLPGPRRPDGTGPDGTAEDGTVDDGTVEETAWALHALLAAGEPPGSPLVAAAARWLLGRRLPDGTWPAAAVNEYVRRCYRYPDTVIATSLAVKALGRLRTALTGTGREARTA